MELSMEHYGSKSINLEWKMNALLITKTKICIGHLSNDSHLFLFQFFISLIIINNSLLK